MAFLFDLFMANPIKELRFCRWRQHGLVIHKWWDLLKDIWHLFFPRHACGQWLMRRITLPLFTIRVYHFEITISVSWWYLRLLNLGALNSNRLLNRCHAKRLLWHLWVSAHLRAKPNCQSWDWYPWRLSRTLACHLVSKEVRVLFIDQFLQDAQSSLYLDICRSDNRFNRRDFIILLFHRLRTSNLHRLWGIITHLWYLLYRLLVMNLHYGR